MPFACLKKNKKGEALLFGLLSVTCIAILLYGRYEPIDGKQPVPSSTKTVQYRFHLRNNGNRPIFESRFSTVAPLQETGTQNCTRIEASHPYTLAVDPNGNRRLQFTFESFPPYASKIISVRATMAIRSTPTPSPEQKANQQTDWIDFSEPIRSDLRSLALRLKSNTPLQTAQNIHRWIAEHLTHTGYSAVPKGANHAFETRQGDCTEYADLFVALARSAGLPARRVSGHLIPFSGKATPATLHDWAEFLDHGVWRMADPQQNNFDRNYTSYAAMSIHGLSSRPGSTPPFSIVPARGKEMLTVKMESY